MDFLKYVSNFYAFNQLITSNWSMLPLTEARSITRVLTRPLLLLNKSPSKFLNRNTFLFLGIEADESFFFKLI
jgi:hypothetical protein